MEATAEKNESLWWLAVSPAIWIVHLLACYITAAIFCAKAGRGDVPLDVVRIAITVYTAVAVAGIAAIGIRGLRRHQYGDASTPHDFDTPEDRHRFLGFASLLLSGISALGVLYVALPAIFIGTCR